MRKFVLMALMACMALTALACEGQKTYVTAPAIAGLELSKARLLISGGFKLDAIDVPTHEWLPGTVIGYGEGITVGSRIKAGSTVSVSVASAPENSYSLANLVQYVSEIDYLTGPESPNYDVLIEAGVGGCDLGIPVDLGDEVILLYGDTFSGVGSMTGLWNSNFIARTTDDRLWDGLSFSSVVTNQYGMVQPIIQGAHNGNASDEESSNPDREVTKIPTGGLKIGDAVYVFYMSVRYWGVGGAWLVSYNQVVKSTDGLNTFEEVEGLRWTDSEAYNFGQIFPIQDPNDPDTIYLLGIPGGRQGGTTLARVSTAHFEDIDEYEYYVGEGQWVKGEAGLAMLADDPYYILDPTCSELSVMYNDYLEKWVVVYLKNSQIVMQTADDLTGPWSQTMALTDSTHYSGLYGGFVNRAFTEYDGKKFYLVISLWLPIYQTLLLEVVLN
jgi:hypothetical protein